MGQNRQLRNFFLAHLQSQMGSGAAYVALSLIAYQRLHSAWAISLVLLAEFLPGIVFAPWFGALADRFSRRRLAIAADLVRAGAFVALAVVPSFTMTVALALVAGSGTALFRPAISAALPGLVPAQQRSQLIALFYACVNVGLTVGPLLTAGLLLIIPLPGVLVANSLTFVASAALLRGVDLGGAEADDLDEEDASARLRTLRAGARALLQLPGLPALLLVSALVVLTGAMFNVLAPLLVTGSLRAGGSGYAVFMALYGGGMVAGTWFNARAGEAVLGLRRRWLLGITFSGAAMAAAAVAPNIALACVAVAVMGLGENLLVGPEMRLVQELVSSRLMGRAFGVKDMLENVAFVAAFVGTAALLTVAGTRTIFMAAGVATVCVAIVGAVVFRPRAPARLTGDPATGKL